MFVPHFLDTDAWSFTDAQRRRIESVVAAAEQEVRPRLNLLDNLINVTIEPSDRVIPEIGIGAFTPGRHLIQVRVDPNHTKALEAVVDDDLYSTIAHEACHAARHVGFPSEAWDPRPIAAAVFEGLGTVFEHEVTGRMPPWGTYDPSVIDAWVEELLALPAGVDSQPWQFTHPDGRRWIAYRAGTRIVENVCRAASVTVPDLLALSTEQILERGGLCPA